METTMTALSYREDSRPAEPGRRDPDFRVGSDTSSPAYATGPLAGGAPQVRVLVVFEVGYRSYRDAIAGAVRDLRPHAEVTVAEPASLQAEVARFSPHLVISSQPSVLDPARTTAWVRLPHEPGFAGEICLRGRCLEAYDLDLTDLLGIFDEVEDLVSA